MKSIFFLLVNMTIVCELNTHEKSNEMKKWNSMWLTETRLLRCCLGRISLNNVIRLRTNYSYYLSMKVALIVILIHFLDNWERHHPEISRLLGLQSSWKSNQGWVLQAMKDCKFAINDFLSWKDWFYTFLSSVCMVCLIMASISSKILVRKIPFWLGTNFPWILNTIVKLGVVDGRLWPGWAG